VAGGRSGGRRRGTTVWPRGRRKQRDDETAARRLRGDGDAGVQASRERGLDDPVAQRPR
jgi:hypothetical protein